VNSISIVSSECKRSNSLNVDNVTAEIQEKFQWDEAWKWSTKSLETKGLGLVGGGGGGGGGGGREGGEGGEGGREGRDPPLPHLPSYRQQNSFKSLVLKKVLAEKTELIFDTAYKWPEILTFFIISISFNPLPHTCI
jgi:hypothetical protein